MRGAEEAGKVALRNLADRWNSLLKATEYEGAGYTYSTEMVLENASRLEAAFGDSARILVSVKANPHSDLCRALGERAMGFDVASPAEARLVAPYRRTHGSFVSQVGPGKSEETIAECLAAGVDQIVIESERELVRLHGLSAHWKPEDVAVLIRVNPAAATVDANEVMGGRPSQFGIDEDKVRSVIERAKDLNIEVSGTHLFLGSQIRTAQDVTRNFLVAQQSSERIAAMGLELRSVSLGGGFGIPHRDSDAVLDLAEVSQSYKESLRELSKLSSQIDGQVESGRYVFGTAGVYLCRITEVKESRGTRFAIVDCGITGFSRPATRWGEEHPVWVLGEPFSQVRGQEYTVVGPTCLPGDVIAEKAMLEAPAEGDVLVVGNAGAYGFSMSMQRWGSLSSVTERVL